VLIQKGRVFTELTGITVWALVWWVAVVLLLLTLRLIFFSHRDVLAEDSNLTSILSKLKGIWL
jgi:hypothetical protein